MSKLLDLLEFRTVPDAAQYLSNQLNETLTEAHVLQLALNGKLQISVNFQNGAKARCGKVSMKLTERIFGPENYEPPSFSYIFYADLFHQDVYDVCERDLPPILSYPLSDGDPRNHEALAVPLEPVSTITGIYDLALSYGARNDVENRYNQIIGGQPVSCTSEDRIIILGQDNEICEIHDECPGRPGSYTRASRLPGDGMLVVRSEALKEFVTTHLDEAVHETESAPRKKASADQAKETTDERYRRILDHINRTPVTRRAYEELAKIEGCGVENIKRMHTAAKKRFPNG